MIDPTDMAARNTALTRLFRSQLGVKSRDLGHALGRAGRRLPRKFRKQGALILRTQRLAGNPKLARQINEVEVDQAYAALTSHLQSIDVADVRRGRFLSLAGIIAANFLLVVAAFVAWLWWTGYV